MSKIETVDVKHLGKDPINLHGGTNYGFLRFFPGSVTELIPLEAWEYAISQPIGKYYVENNILFPLAQKELDKEEFNNLIKDDEDDEVEKPVAPPVADHERSKVTIEGKDVDDVEVKPKKIKFNVNFVKTLNKDRIEDFASNFGIEVTTQQTKAEMIKDLVAKVDAKNAELEAGTVDGEATEE